MAADETSRASASPLILLFTLVFALIGSGCDLRGHDEATSQERGISSLEAVRHAATITDMTSTIVGRSESERYLVEIRAERAPPRRGDLHAWLARVVTLEGNWIQPTRLAFSGGMPQHGHGFETMPHVTDALADGWFRVGGVRFHMAGEWEIRVEFVGPEGSDVAVFEVVVPH